MTVCACAVVASPQRSCLPVERVAYPFRPHFRKLQVARIDCSASANTWRISLAFGRKAMGTGSIFQKCNRRCRPSSSLGDARGFRASCPPLTGGALGVSGGGCRQRPAAHPEHGGSREDRCPATVAGLMMRVGTEVPTSRTVLVSSLFEVECSRSGQRSITFSRDKGEVTSRIWARTRTGPTFAK
jgi:hypothetical protein